MKILFSSALLVITCFLLSTQVNAENYAMSNFYPFAEAKPHVLPRYPILRNHSLKSAAPIFNLQYYGANAPVMTGTVNIYVIYWAPTKLQDGSTVNWSQKYQQYLHQFLTDITTANGLSAVTTQYYQVNKDNSKTYISGNLNFAGEYVDTNPYPLANTNPKIGNCPESMASKKNCLEDSDVQKEIARIVALKKWPVNNSTMYLMYTVKGEDECDGTGSCVSGGPNAFCGYHGNVSQKIYPNTTPIIYSILPYTTANGCGPQVFPQNFPDAEAVASTTTHEIYESITDPIGNSTAWNTIYGEEIGDLCVTYQLTSKNLTWANGKANHMWNGNYYALQPEYDNHIQACADIGP